MKTRRITEAEYLANLEAELNKTPPEGAFTLADALKMSNRRRSAMQERLNADVRNGVLNSDVFALNGHSVRYYWVAS